MLYISPPPSLSRSEQVKNKEPLKNATKVTPYPTLPLPFSDQSWSLVSISLTHYFTSHSLSLSLLLTCLSLCLCLCLSVSLSHAVALTLPAEPVGASSCLALPVNECNSHFPGTELSILIPI